MSHSVTGKLGTFVIGATAVGGKLRNWKRTINGRQVEDTGAGDVFVGRLGTFTDYTIEAEYELPASAYATYASLINTQCHVVCKIQAGDSAAFIDTTCICTDDEVTLQYDDVVTGRITFKSDGSTPVAL